MRASLDNYTRAVRSMYDNKPPVAALARPAEEVEVRARVRASVLSVPCLVCAV